MATSMKHASGSLSEWPKQGGVQNWGKSDLLLPVHEANVAVNYWDPQVGQFSVPIPLQFNKPNTAIGIVQDHGCGVIRLTRSGARANNKTEKSGRVEIFIGGHQEAVPNQRCPA